MRTVLIPTDFSVDSLVAIKKTLQINEHDEIKIILFHCISLSDSITDLLSFSKGRLIRELSSKTFINACEIIRNKFSENLRALHIEIFTGNTHNAFENFVQANDVDIICVLEEFIYKTPSRYSQDANFFIKKSSIPVFSIKVESLKSPVAENELSVLFSELN